jgi:hypothetical protein
MRGLLVRRVLDRWRLEARGVYPILDRPAQGRQPRLLYGMQQCTSSRGLPAGSCPPRSATRHGGSLMEGAMHSRASNPGGIPSMNRSTMWIGATTRSCEVFHVDRMFDGMRAATGGKVDHRVRCPTGHHAPFFEFRRIRSQQGVWRANYTPKLMKRTG